MANKFLKRTLSVVMCAAMLVSVFAGSFTVSADETATNPTTTNEDGTTTTTYQWDYTGTGDSDSTVADTLNTFGITDATATHGTGYQFSNGSNATNNIGEETGFLQMTSSSALIPFTTPGNTVPSSFTLVAPNNSDKTETAVSTGAPIIGSAKKSDGTITYSVFVASMIRNSYIYCDLVLQGSDGTKTTQPITLKNDYCTSGSSRYFDLRSNVKDGWNGYIIQYLKRNLTYTYTIVPGEDNSVAINISINYNRPTATIETEKLYTFTADPITISLDTINEMYNDGTTTVSDFTPSFGIASGWYYNNSQKLAAKVYSVNAVYKKGDDTVEPEITASANVVLNDGVNLKITAEGNEGIQADTLKLTVDGEEKELTNGAAIIPKFAHQMADKMKIVITADDVNGNTITKTIGDDESGYSIADNLANTYDQLTAEKDAATKKLIAKLANYGAAAQQYDALANNIEYTQLANYFLDDADKTPDAEAYNTMESVLKGTFVKEDSDVFTTGLKASLAIGLQENIKMIIRVSGINLGDNQNLYVKMDGTDYPLTEKNGVYTGQFGEFKPKEYADSKTITLVVKSNDTETSAEEEVSGEVTYSVGTYINRMASKSSDGLKLLLNAITEYSTAYAEVYNALTNA